jgi:predicted transcriptional regulator
LYLSLGERERQIMESLYQRGRATVAEVLDDIPDAPSYNAIRTMLTKLERKGLVRHVEDGPRYVYMATTRRSSAQISAVRRVLNKLFDGSAERTVAAVLNASGPISAEELARIEELIQKKKQQNQARSEQ